MKCCNCHIEYERNKYNTVKLCTKCNVKKKRTERKAYLVKKLGGKCVICGYDSCLRALSFHHVNPDEKECKISEISDKNISAMEKEADKCVLVCENCHKELDTYEKSLSKSGNCTCSICGRKYDYDRSLGHTKNKCNSCITALQKRAIKKRLVELKGGKCSICGYDRCLAALNFHHTEPGKKEFALSNAKRQPWAKVLKELKKCILVCSNCHMELHSAETGIEPITAQ